jgi:hypothetical protein
LPTADATQRRFSAGRSVAVGAFVGSAQKRSREADVTHV